MTTLARAYRLPEERLLRTGYPRNDALIAERTRAETEGRLPRPPLAAELGLDDHKKTVLYAPTFRGGPGKQRKARLLLDVREFAERFGDTHTLLVRAHYLESARLPVCPPGTVVDVSRHHDVSELLTITDVLVTDYSSIMFDFALLDRPVVLFAPDLETYAAERGGYFDLREQAPGPVTATQEELFAALAELKKSDTRYADRRRAFAERFGVHDRGDAARATVAAVFGPTASRGVRDTTDHDQEAAEMSRDIFIVSNSTDELGGVTGWMHQTARLFAGQGHRVHTIGIHASDLKMTLPRQPEHPVTALYPAHPRPRGPPTASATASASPPGARKPPGPLPRSGPSGGSRSSSPPPGPAPSSSSPRSGRWNGSGRPTPPVCGSSG
ncbi:hypothetical protein SBADM41S_10175 [Streptomyces badius]